MMSAKGMENVGWCIVFLSLVHASASTNCGPLPRIEGTEVINPKETYSNGQKVQYKCVGDYESFNGSRSIECLGGKWTKLSLVCRKKLCESVELSNGQLDYSNGNSIGDKAKVTCNDGYTLKGMESLLCTKSGWSDTTSCEKSSAVNITCHGPSVDNAVMTGGGASVYRSRDTVDFTCSPGFSLTGSQQITCGEDGQWEPQLPQCLKSKRPKYCPELPNIPNSRYLRHKKAGSVINITCIKGFQLKGAAQVNCSEEGKWVGEIPTCSPVPTTVPPARGCGEPDYTSNSKILQEQYRGQASFPDGARVRYECDLGYAWANGSPFRTCRGRKWTRLQITCERKSCGSAGEVLYGQYIYTGAQFGDSATAICDEGYQLVGHNIRRCMNGGWDGRVAVCEAVQCAEPPETPGVVRSGTMEAPYVQSSVVSYYCLMGKLMGPSMIYCTKDGEWSAKPPICKDVRCDIPRFNNAVRTVPVRSRYEFGDKVSFRCRQGAIVERLVTCGLDGKWSPPRPCGW